MLHPWWLVSKIMIFNTFVQHHHQLGWYWFNTETTNETKKKRLTITIRFIVSVLYLKPLSIFPKSNNTGAELLKNCDYLLKQLPLDHGDRSPGVCCNVLDCKRSLSVSICFRFSIFTSQELQMLSSVTINCQVFKDCHEFRFLIVRIVNSVSNVLGLSKNLKIFPKPENLPKIRKSSKNLKFFQKSENLPKIWKSFKNLKIFQKICLIKCLKGHKSLGSLCSVVKTLIVSLVRQRDRPRDKVTYWAVVDS